MKMRLSVCSCLVAVLLGCNVTAEIVEEKKSISLRCPPSVPVDGPVTWSRETNGHRVDLLTVDGDGERRHIDDRLRRYSSLADKSFHIHSVLPSDTGRYFCNNSSTELTVIPEGTTRLAAERTTITLTCPHDAGGPTWSRETGRIKHQGRFDVSYVDKTLTVRDVQPGDSGLYYCDGKLAAYLIVTKDETSERDNKTPLAATSTTPAARGRTAAATRASAAPPPARTAAPSPPSANTDTTRPRKNRDKNRDRNKGKKTPTPTAVADPGWTTTIKPVATKVQQPLLALVLGIVVPFVVLLLLIVIYITRRRRMKRRETEERYAIYGEVCHSLEVLPTNGVTVFCDQRHVSCRK
ncbi:uncharacterized protein LOC121619775 isoform X2 [Chelmon rostratus]|uniref:uncharacterized protein LOC121619775 isoform X2 n=1 Tax=Chelmon rostratus TaxID=109905 RepID=UPI001BEBDFD9|nr:uncharacterized protein LOC121619775 isoform X2 [Chelmon rostratus]